LYTVDVSNDNWPLLTVTPSGAISTIGSTHIDFRGLAYDPNHDILYGVGSDHIRGGSNLYTINTSNAQVTLIGSTGFTRDTLDLAFDPFADILYMNLG